MISHQWTDNGLQRFVRATAWTGLPVMIALALAAFPIRAADPAADTDRAPIDVLVVVGAPGTPEFGESFQEWADTWAATCQRSELVCETIGARDDDASPDRQRLQSTLDALGTQAASSRPLWIVLIGHGTWDGTSADFNLVGRDVNARELGSWLKPIERPQIVVNCTSSSGPFIDRLSARDRVIVTATKSGSEQNFARFGGYFAAAFSSLDADLDHDDSISVKEAFLKAAADTERFYKEQGRLATEHALLDDNHDKRGSSWSLVLGRAESKDDGQVDGAWADRFTLPATSETVRLSEARAEKRDQLETKLRDLKSKFGEGQSGALREQALPILLDLAKIYAAAEAEQDSDSQSDSQSDQ